MKRKWTGIMLGLMLLAGVSAQAASAAQETETEMETETETEKAEDFTVTVGDADVTVSNTSGVTIAEAVYEKEDGEDAGTLTLTEEDGAAHTFEEAEEETWTEPELYEEYGFLYVKYQDSQGDTKELPETAEEKELEEEATVYALTNVNIREEPDQESERISGVQTGDSLTVTAAVPGWLKIKTGETEGYVAHSYFTEDEEKAQEAVEAEQAATESVTYTYDTTPETTAQKTTKKQTEAAETTAETTAPETTAETTAPETTAPETTAQTAAAETSAPTVVSTQDYDDCDGSGHGYREITWSDGSVTYEDY